MPVVRLPIAVPPREREWIEFREMIACAARKMHLDAFSSDATNQPELLMIAKTFSDLALSIVPPAPADASGGSQDTSIVAPAGGVLTELKDEAPCLPGQAHRPR